MKRVSFFTTCILVLSCLPCWSQAPINEYYPDNTLKTEWISQYEDELIRKEYYLSGYLKNESEYKGGKLFGIYKSYYEDGQIHERILYENALEQGPYKVYGENGLLVEEGAYESGKLEGIQKLYARNGRIYKETEYHKGAPHGVMTVYYPDGIVQGRYPYVDGEISGISKFYDEQGLLAAESLYQENLREGLTKEYYSTGELHRQMTFLHDQIDGEIIEYYQSQVIKSKEMIENGILINQLIYDQNGTLINKPIVSTSKPSEKENVFYQWIKDLLNSFEDIFGEVLGWSLLFIFLVVGVFIGSVVKESKIMRYSSKENVADKKEYIGGKKEFNTLHSESEKMYRSLVETVKSGIFMADANGNLFYVNNTFAQIFGFQTKQEVIGKNARNQFRSIDYEEKNLLSVMGDSNEIYDFQFKYRLKNGNFIILSVSANRIFDESGKSIGLQGVVSDVTEKHQLEMEILNEKKKLESILEFFESIDSIRDFKELMGFASEGTAKVLDANACLVMLESSKEGVFQIQGSFGVDTKLGEQFSIDCNDKVMGDVIRNGNALLVKNIEYDQRFLTVSRPGILGRSFIVIPVESKDKVTGLVIVTNKHKGLKMDVAFDETDLKVLEIISGKVSGAIENIKVYDDLNVQTVVDPITKIYNYRLLSSALDREILRFSREKSQFFVFMMDIDDFKSYNDTFGHPEGDALLTNLGKIFTSQTRKTDIVCRYAGDEFCIVLPDTDSKGSTILAEKIIKAVEQFKFKRTVTISIGIAGYVSGMTKKDLISKADKALYQAKHAGKNQIVLSEG